MVLGTDICAREGTRTLTPEGTGPVASGGDNRLQLAGAVAAGRDQDPSAPEGASADLKEEERAVWLVVLELVNEALDGG